MLCLYHSGTNPLKGKALKLAIAVCILAMLAPQAFRLVLQKNQDMPGVEAYIRASDPDRSRFGTVEKISVTGVTSVAPSSTLPGYTVYKVYVQGGAGSDFVKVYVTHPSGTAVFTEKPPHCCGLK